MDSITVTPTLLIPTSEKHLTPAMITALWVISGELDRNRIPANTKDAVWLKIPSSQLRGADARNDNIWLRQCLERLTGLKISGTYRGDPWGGVVVAEWHIEQGGSLVRILVPPAAVQAIRAPETFTKIETMAAYKLQGAAKLLYALLADKKHIKKTSWTFGVDELRELLNVSHKTSYQRWNNFRYRVLDPALEQINDYGTVTVKMTTLKKGRSIDAVRFDWNWKSLDDARYTDEENEQPDGARHMDRLKDDAPPLTDRITIEAMPELAQRLHNDLDPTHWLSWFKDCQFVEEPEIGQVTITANTDFMAKHINENYRVKIEQLGRLCATPVAKVEIKSRAK